MALKRADMAYRYLVLRTAFHGGGVWSRHHSSTRAAESVERYRRGCGCSCGCVGVWDTYVQGAPPQYGGPVCEGNPYQLCSR